MVSFMVIDKTGGKTRGLGSHQFAVAPQAGDFITLSDEQGIGQAYRVKAVIHPLDPAEHAGDLIIEHVGTDVQLRTQL